MSSWGEGPFLGFDTETTGVDVERDRIVTAALVRRDRGHTRARIWLIDPGVEIPEAATAIHGISTARARTEGADPALALSQIADELARAQLDGVPVVAFNAAFDLAILDHELARHGLPSLAERIGHPCTPVIDPLVLDRALDPDRAGTRRLADLCAHYAVGDRDGLHTAEVDVVATLDVLAGIAARFPQITDLPLRALHRWQAEQHEEWAVALNAWRAAQGVPGPGAAPGWPVPRAAPVAGRA